MRLFSQHGHLDKGVVNTCVDTADASAAWHTDVDVASLPPGSTPGVLNDPIVVWGIVWKSRWSGVSYSKHSVVGCGSALCGGNNTGSVLCENRLWGFHVHNVGSGEDSLLHFSLSSQVDSYPWLGLASRNVSLGLPEWELLSRTRRARTVRRGEFICYLGNDWIVLEVLKTISRCTAVATVVAVCLWAGKALLGWVHYKILILGYCHRWLHGVGCSERIACSTRSLVLNRADFILWYPIPVGVISSLIQRDIGRFSS